MQIFSCKKLFANKFEHIGILSEGEIKLNQLAHVKVDSQKRLNIARNHSATHLLHKSLCDIIGDNVKQMGSYIDDHGFRFDFSCSHKLNEKELSLIEDSINDKIFSCMNVDVSYKNIKDAIDHGAKALFDEKYGDIVRVVNMCDYSIELCSGIHVSNTSQIGIFKIISETGVSSGVRRIEAVTANDAKNYFDEQEKLLDQIQQCVKSNKSNVLDKIKNLIENNKIMSAQINNAKLNLAHNAADEIIQNKKRIGNIDLLIYSNKDSNMESIRMISDYIKSKLESCIIFLIGKEKEKFNVFISTQKNSISIADVIDGIVNKFGGKGIVKKNTGQIFDIKPDDIDMLTDYFYNYVNSVITKS
jgi:alanyl-tRNA synthetase